MKCKNCNCPLSKSQRTYCSNKCQADFQYKKYIEKWKRDSRNGGRGVPTKNISRHIKRYLVEINGEKCSSCGWRKKHPTTKKVPLEVDHIDGDPENNNLNNLSLLCPNCHALTPSFRNLNKGNGRRWRK
ncbi:HNH endonuclease [Candidatus Kaiserbacteria bacterium]|nr:HNH endonuclease [Candidatus Kaiserbacteria bacterium]